MTDVGIGLIGTGFMGKCHALAFGAVKAVFGEVPKPRLQMLCDIDPQTAQARAQEWGFMEYGADWRVLVHHPKVDIVAITAPNRLHKEMAIAAAKAGKAVYCEKPMGISRKEAEEMAQAIQDAKVVSLLGYNYLRNPMIQQAKKMIAEGAIGRVFHWRGFCDEDYMADPHLPYSWRCKIEEAGSGTLGDLACHLISIAHFLLGPIESIIGQTEIIHEYRPISGSAEKGQVENDDIAQALVRFQNGASGILCSSRVAWGKKNYLAFEVHGDQGMLSFDQERMNELRYYQAGKQPDKNGFTTILAGPVHQPYDAFLPAPGHQLGFNDLKVIEVAHLLRAYRGLEVAYPDFQAGLTIEKVLQKWKEPA